MDNYVYQDTDFAIYLAYIICILKIYGTVAIVFLATNALHIEGAQWTVMERMHALYEWKNTYKLYTLFCYEE